MKLPSIFVFLAMSFLTSDASTQTCVGLLQIPPNASKTLAEFFSNFMSSNPPCGSAKAVLHRVLNREKTGGRKLESDKPLDMKQAQTNLDAAMKNPEIRARIEKARREITDENARLAYEAAIFDDEGYYDARELKIQHLLQRLN